jgi:hypothetical protein
MTPANANRAPVERVVADALGCLEATVKERGP